MYLASQCIYYQYIRVSSINLFFIEALSDNRVTLRISATRLRWQVARGAAPWNREHGRARSPLNFHSSLGGRRTARPSRMAAKSERAEPGEALEPPFEFVCPITCEIFRDPVVAADGHTYEREAIEQWIRRRARSPVTNLPLANSDLVPNINMKKLVADFVEAAAAAARAARADEAGRPSVAGLAAQARPSTSLLELAKHFRDLDPIRDQLAQTLDGWKPPVIAVVGNESCGKSTILERLAWMPLFPKGEDLCTRLPILVSLRCRAQAASPTLRVMEGDRVVSEKQFDSPDCQEVVRGCMLQVIRNENRGSLASAGANNCTCSCRSASAQSRSFGRAWASGERAARRARVHRQGHALFGGRCHPPIQGPGRVPGRARGWGQDEAQPNSGRLEQEQGYLG